jgi:hypothetical protein
VTTIWRGLLCSCLVLLATPVPSWGQTQGRLAVGVDVSSRIASSDGADGRSGAGFLWRFGQGREGWGWRCGLSWYSVDVMQPVGERAPSEFGSLRIRPILVGYGYARRFGPVLVTGKLMAGYAFNTFRLNPTFDDAYRERLGATTVTADASNGVVVKPDVSAWIDLGRKIGLNVSAGYMVARPGVTVTSSLGRDRRHINADMLMLKIGAVYSVF